MIHELSCCRLEVKGYRRDLRRAHAKIESLQAVSLHRPPTPDGESASSSRGNPSPQMPRAQPVRSPHYGMDSSDTAKSGLGISLPQQMRTPTKTVASAATAALLSPTPPPKDSGISSPAARPKTPLSTHKKLPKPPPSPKPQPSAATTPPPSIKLQRNETLRSLSESIISSYTKRSTAEEELHSTPPSRDRSSAPLQSLGSPMVPLSKFATPQATPTGSSMADV